MQRLIINVMLVLLVTLSTSSCKKYLEASSDKSLVIPTSIKELQGLLDNEKMFSSYISVSDLSNDNMYISYSDWSAIESGWKPNQDAYIWNPITDLTIDWANAYSSILNANVVLGVIDDFIDTTTTIAEKNQVKGCALFYRAAYYYELAQHFSPPYSPASAQSVYGIPLKSSPNVEDPTIRATVQQTYDFIIHDLKASIPLLSSIQAEPTYKTRPSKAASYGLLSRLYLSMSDYPNALLYSDSCLTIYNTLMDYNDISLVDTNSNTPFRKFNAEVIFQAISRYGIAGSTLTRGKVDTILYDSYDVNDLRKPAYFRPNPDGSFRFKGNYNGSAYSIPFTGIATDEIYLIRSECYARQGKVTEAITDLNNLLITRWRAGTFSPITASTTEEALSKILQERRKELCFRPSLRWMDLRRLNLDSNYAITLNRELNGIVYTLSPNDLRYTYLIPSSVIEMSRIEQNPR
ncbi:MAG: RagB/SusD family nutrient uptake outer membrane protein [Chitinophagaceae bacterium]|nr:RagB/SusD family nutrient uptake outer membrane protein [Chitinophagaceae bacterium]